MNVVGSTNHHGINCPGHLVEHLAVILEFACSRESVEDLSGASLIHVAQGHNIMTGQSLEIVCAPATAAHESQVQFLTGRS
jgi:hypothetical protein